MAAEESREYKRRWLMLAIFILCSTVNAMQWLQYSIISNIMMRYYKVSSLAIDLTSIVYEVCYMPFVFPASWLLQHKGLRVTLLCGAAMMAVGSWIKVLSASPDRFYVAFVGQALVGTAQIFILGVPSRLAAVWFPLRQVSTACALGVFGIQIGTALGFLIPPLVVHNHESLDAVGQDLSILNYLMAAGPTFALLLVISLFQKEPPTPAQPVGISDKNSYVQSMKALLSNRNFNLLLVSYGIITGISYVVSTLLNQMVLHYFPNGEQDAGRIGLSMLVAGILGSVSAGVILDKTHKFKQCLLVVYVMALLGALGFAFSFMSGKLWTTYVSLALLGFFMLGCVSVGYEFAVELTYPIPEGTSSGILNFSREVFGIVFTLIAGQILHSYGDMAANLSLVGLLVAGLVIALFISGKDLKRQVAMNKG